MGSKHHPAPIYVLMGTGFRKLKVPFVWYDLLHVLDVLVRFPWVQEAPRFIEILMFLKSKADGRESLCSNPFG
jgi:hypothetical protein